MTPPSANSKFQYFSNTLAYLIVCNFIGKTLGGPLGGLLGDVAGIALYTMVIAPAEKNKDTSAQTIMLTDVVDTVACSGSAFIIGNDWFHSVQAGVIFGCIVLVICLLNLYNKYIKDDFDDNDLI